MKRKLLNLITAISLLVAVTASWLWYSSHAWIAGFAFETPGSVRPLTIEESRTTSHRVVFWQAHYGGIAVSHQVYVLYHDLPEKWNQKTTTFVSPYMVISHDLIKNGYGVVDTEFEIPYWLLFAFAIYLPIAWTIQFRRRTVRLQRLARGECQACGYDLRSSPERCPECGVENAKQVQPLPV